MSDEEVIVLTDSEGKRYRVTEEVFFANTEVFSLEVLVRLKEKPQWLERYLRNIQCAR